MKKPIDPNLGADGIALPDLEGSENESFGFNDYERPKPVDPEFHIAEGIIVPSEPEVKPGEPVTGEAVSSVSEEKSSGSSGEHHHHSSDGHHHRHHHHHHHHHHHSGSHHHHSSKKKKKKKLPLPARIALAIIIVLLLAVLVAVGTFFGLRMAGKKDIMPDTQNAQYQEIIEYNGHKYKYNEDVLALGFVGVDRRALLTYDETDFVGAGDSDIVFTVDTKTGEAKVIAIPRDTMVDIDINSESGIFIRTQKAQLCLAYAYGDGAEQSCLNSINAMSRILYDVPIQKYFVLDLDGIAPLNDAIGGVTVESLYNFADEGIAVGDTVTIRGDMAEKYVRERSMDDINASLNRVDRQVQYIKAYAQQALPAVVRDFGVISSLYNTAMDYSQTNLTLSNATYLGSLLLSKGVTDYTSYTLQGEMKSAKATEYNMEGVVHAEFYPDEDYLMQTVLDVFYTQID